MNTAQGHFNEDQMANGPMGQRIVFGGVTGLDGASAWRCRTPANRRSPSCA